MHPKKIGAATLVHINDLEKPTMLKNITPTMSLFCLCISLLFVPITTMAAEKMGFFVTSTGSGDGANLGGLQGADAHCQKLAVSVGAGDRQWAAYLSTQGANAVNARDRIGSGPWYNAQGTLVAGTVAGLYTDALNLNHETALDEAAKSVPYIHLDATGAPLPREDQPARVQHDILTGTQEDGTAFPGDEDKTCSNWTSNGSGSAQVGHHDRRSLRPGFSPWGAAHPSKGCSQADLVGTGGAGLFYCFATD